MNATDSCWRHRDALAALADRRVPVSEYGSTLAHLEHCPTCAATLGELTLTVVALRRMESVTAVAQPDAVDDAWARLRVRIERSRQRAREEAWRWRATLSGLAAASLLVAAFVGPAAIHPTETIGSDEPSVQSAAVLELPDWQVEQGYVSAARRSIDMAPPEDVSASSGGVPQRTIYPDGIRPERKEVPSGRATTRFPEAG
jgi:anti-sigma factor RsiW